MQDAQALAASYNVIWMVLLVALIVAAGVGVIHLVRLSRKRDRLEEEGEEKE